MASVLQDQPKHNNIVPKQQHDDDSTVYAQALNLSVAAYVIPMALKAAIELNVFEIIGEAGPGAQLSPPEIVWKIPNGTSSSTARAAVELDRILRYLASYGVLTCSVAAGGGGGKRYGLAPVCKFYRKNVDGNGMSLVPLIQMNLDKAHLDSWQQLKCGVVEGVVPFRKAHGMSFFDYQGAHPILASVFNQSMSDLSNLLLKKMLDNYTGFQGVQGLVDVAGGIGTTLRTIVAKFPHIKGTNFDLPHVISDAPPISGVEHVGGDMFASVPRGDAIFLKFVLHNWHDEGCLKLLKNCFEALPESGKVIVMDYIVPEVPESNIETQITFYGDLCMMAYFDGGKERTLKEFEFLAREAGFITARVACCAYGVSVMELLK